MVIHSSLGLAPDFASVSVKGNRISLLKLDLGVSEFGFRFEISFDIFLYAQFELFLARRCGREI